jgi:hypothetical protein
MSIKAMKQALEALERVMSHGPAVQEAINALRTAIERTEKQEQSRPPDYHPCTEVLIQGLKDLKGGGEVLAKWDAVRAHVDSMITTPPAAQRWVGLTDEDIEKEFGFIDELLRDCVHRTEAKLKERNT